MNYKIKNLVEMAQMRPFKDGWIVEPDQDVVFERLAELVLQECIFQLQSEDIRHSGFGYNQTELHRKIKTRLGFGC